MAQKLGQGMGLIRGPKRLDGGNKKGDKLSRPRKWAKIRPNPFLLGWVSRGVGFGWVWMRGGRGEGWPMTWCHVVVPIEVQKPAFKPINVVFKITPHPKNKEKS